MVTLTLLVAVLLLGTGVRPAPPSPPSTDRTRHPDFSGVWVLIGERTGAPGGLRRGSGGRQFPGAGGVETGAEAAGPGRPSGLGELLRPKRRLEIEQSDTIVTVKDDAGWLRYLLPNDRAMREELGQGGPAIVVSRWDKNRLVTERTLAGGLVYRETYELDERAGRLRVEVEFRTARMPRPVRVGREYAREGPGGGGSG
jgi:hypothetical protein